MKSRAAHAAGGYPNAAVMALDDGMADGKSHSHSLSLGCEKRVENFINISGVNSCPAVRDRNMHHSRFSRSRFYFQNSTLPALHRLDGIHYQVQDDLLQLDLVALYGGKLIVEVCLSLYEGNLRQALDRQQLLIKEVNHRVNNSLSIVASMLHLHSSVAESNDVRHELREASNRIAAIARAHQRLYRSDQIDTLDLGAYLTEVCKDISDSLPSCEVNVSADEGIRIRTDRAIPAVLLVNELVTNAAKYAYPAGNCRVWVTLTRAPGDAVIISVRDDGVGLPATFDIKSARRLGMRLVDAFAQQLQGQLTVLRREPGTEFTLRLPLT